MSSGLVDALRLFIHRRFYTEKQIKNYQERELRKLISLSIRNSPFYRERFNGIDIQHLSDLMKVSPINKAIMMGQFDRLNTVGLLREEVQNYAVQKELDHDYLGYYKDRYVIGLSSGTSGNKGLYVTPRELTAKLPFVFLARGGIPLRYLPFRILFCLRVFGQGFEDINSPIVKLAYCSTMTPIQEIVELINTKHINILMAPPSLIRLLLPVHKQIKVQIKQIVCYAEVLEKEEKERFSKVFNTGVVEIYQASEGQIASACSHGTLHINEDMVIVELRDDKGNIVDQPGVVASHMYVTNLVNAAQPLIRYEMNDLIALGKPCACGSKFRTIDHILGRNDDILHFKTTDGKDQTVFPDLFSRWIITTSDAIREYQVIQKDAHSVEVHIDLLADSEPDPQLVITQLFTRLTQELSQWNIQADVEIFAKKIELPADRSKYKRFIVTLEKEE
jgi:putative adenylate-forming enzyme